MKGQIVKILSNQYTVDDGYKTYECHARGKFRNEKLCPLVGDYVLFDEKNNYILQINPRRNYLVRPPVSNIDQVFIVTSLKEPDFSTNLLDKLLITAQSHGIKPIICVTKCDLCTQRELKEYKRILKYYKKIGYMVVYNTDRRKIKRLLKNKTSAFTGQSGSGKSTLLNNLDATLVLETNEISKALGRGKHTTRFVQLINLCKGKVLDTPGFSSMDFSDIDKDKLKDLFIEFNKYPCNYSNCNHILEEDCNVKKNVLRGNILESRYNNYVKIFKS